MLRITFFIIFVIGLIRKAEGQQVCTSSVVTNGYCVKSDDCPPIKAVVDNPQKRRVDALYIKESYCGNIKGKLKLIKVCCSKKDAVLGCDLPKSPEIGTYTLVSATPHNGNRVPIGTLIKYICDKKSTDETPDVKYFSHCQDDGEWSEVEPCAAKNCLAPKSKTVKFICTRNKKQIPCEEAKENDTALPQCKTGHLPRSSFDLNTLMCINGTWNHPIPECVAECGEEIAQGRALIFNGHKEDIRNSPWHVAVYRKIESIHQYICGGTIITNTLVISAAFCFTVPRTGKVLPPDNYSIIAGININKWDSAEETAQKSDVKIIKVPENFLGIEGNLRNNIAVIILKTELEFGNFVHPACLDLENKYQMIDGSVGKIAGWGVTKPSHQHLFQASENLMVASMPIINFETCKKQARFDFKSFVTDDKVCGGYRNGTTPCKGDNGGGLVMPFTKKPTVKYYLKAVLSSGEIDNEGHCRLDSYVTFTNLLHHIRFILMAIDQEK